MAPVIGGLPGQKAETASQLIQQYVDWIISQTPLTAQQKPATAGFMLTQNNPASFGKEPTTSQPEVVYSQGVLAYSGIRYTLGIRDHSIQPKPLQGGARYGLCQPRNEWRSHSEWWPFWSLTLHHDVLVGSPDNPLGSRAMYLWSAIRTRYTS
jgi:hypothetical protein